MAASVLLHLLVLGYLRNSASTPVDCTNLELKPDSTPDPGLLPKLTVSASEAKLSCDIELDGTQKIAEVYALFLSAGTVKEDKVINPKYINDAKIDSDKLKWEKCSGKTSNSYVTQAQDLELNKVSFGWTPDESEFGAAKSLEATVFAVVCVKDASKKKKCSKVVQSKTQTLTKQPSGSDLPVDCSNLALEQGATPDPGLVPKLSSTSASGAKLSCEIELDGTQKIAEVYALVLSAGTVKEDKVINPKYINDAKIDSDKLKWEKCSGKTSNSYVTQAQDLELNKVSFGWTPDESEFGAAKSLEATVFAVVCVKDASKKKKCSKVVQSKTQTLTKQPSGSDLPVDCSNLALEQGATPDPGLVPKLSSTSASGAKLSCEIELDGTQKIAEVYALVLSAGTVKEDKVINPKYINDAKIDSDKLKWEKCSGKTSNSYVTQAQDLELNKVSFGWTPDESEFGAAKSLEATVFAVVCVKDASKKKKCSKVVQSKTQTLTKQPSGSDLPVDCSNLALEQGATPDPGLVPKLSSTSASGAKLSCEIELDGTQKIAEVYALVLSAGTVKEDKVINPKYINDAKIDSDKLKWEKCSGKTSNSYVTQAQDLELNKVSFGWTPDESEFGAAKSLEATVFAVVCVKDASKKKKCSKVVQSQDTDLDEAAFWI
ncbi:hypothetical protein MTO96_001989 [Rhipicephalus appendiculatus]